MLISVIANIYIYIERERDYPGRAQGAARRRRGLDVGRQGLQGLLLLVVVVVVVVL